MRQNESYLGASARKKKKKVKTIGSEIFHQLPMPLPTAISLEEEKNMPYTKRTGSASNRKSKWGNGNSNYKIYKPLNREKNMQLRVAKTKAQAKSFIRRKSFEYWPETERPTNIHMGNAWPWTGLRASNSGNFLH